MLPQVLIDNSNTGIVFPSTVTFKNANSVNLTLGTRNLELNLIVTLPLEVIFVMLARIAGGMTYFFTTGGGVKTTSHLNFKTIL